MYVVYSFPLEEEEHLDKILRYDPYTDMSLSSEELEKRKNDIIFVRHNFYLREGSLLGFDPNRVYLLLEGDDDFIKKAYDKLSKEVKGIRREDDSMINKFREYIEKENENISSGIGSMF